MNKTDITPSHRSLRVGLDIDGVLYDFRQAFSDWACRYRDYRHCTMDTIAPSWDFYAGWGLTLDEFFELYTTGVDAGQILRQGVPLPGAVDATRRLAAAGHSIHLVTDRSIGTQPGIAARHTAAWLDEWDFVFDSLTISADKTCVPTDFFLEDKYENYVALTDAGVEAYLITRPWNTERGDHTTRRVATIEEFVDIVIEAGTHHAAPTPLDQAEIERLVLVGTELLAGLGGGQNGFGIVVLPHDAGVAITDHRRGGGTVYVHPDGSVLFAGSEIDYASGLREFESGRRTDPALFEQATGNPSTH